MSPVHVIVGEDQRAEAMWASAFTGAVDLYRFNRNVDAFERLTAAEAPVDLVILTPAQQGPFNITPDQFVARVLEGPLGASRFLANLHVIVVGQPLEREHPRAMSVSTLDAAIRLVKFGEVERAPKPAVMQEAAPVRPAMPPRGAQGVDEILADAGIAGSVISSIWDSPARTKEPAEQARPSREAAVVGGGSPRPAAEPVVPAAAAQAAPENPQLFARAVAAGFMAPATNVPAATPQQHAPVAAAPMASGPQLIGGGSQPVPQVGIEGESIEVATGALQPARPYQLPNGAGYRGPGVRADRINAGSVPAVIDSGGQPVPPALASQVQSMVYGGMVGNPSDPLLTWSSSVRNAAAPVPAPEQTPAQPMAAAPMPAAMPVPTVPTVPLEPPAGAYGGVAPQQSQQPAAPSADPFLHRAEQGGGVSFG
jgi:hypothetical protein